MTKDATTEEKVQKPAVHFEEPLDVVADPSLSKPQKAKALDTLEQDARQLSEASAEGMAGGERTKLHEVLKAKEALVPPAKPAPTAR